MSVKHGNINLKSIVGISKIYHGKELILFNSYANFTKDELIQKANKKAELGKSLLNSGKLKGYSDFSLLLNKLLDVNSIVSTPEHYDKDAIIKAINELEIEIEKAQAYIAGGGIKLLISRFIAIFVGWLYDF